MKNWVSAFLFLSMTGLLFGSEDACTNFGLSCSKCFVKYCTTNYDVVCCPSSYFFNINTRSCEMDLSCCDPQLSKETVNSIMMLTYDNAVEAFLIAKDSARCLDKARDNPFTPSSSKSWVTGRKCDNAHLVKEFNITLGSFVWRIHESLPLFAYDGTMGCNILFSSCCPEYNLDFRIFQHVSHWVMRSLAVAENFCPGIFDLPKMIFQK